MARRASSAPTSAANIPTKTLVVDPGANTIKAGFSSTEASPSQSSDAGNCHIIPNCIARSRDKRTYIGSALSKCNDFGEMAFKRPVEKGYVVNWEAEKAIWEQEFFNQKAALYCDPSETNLLLTQPPNAPLALQSNTDQIIFEEFAFASLYRCSSPTLTPWTDLPSLFSDAPISSSDPSALIHPSEICLVIDSGHSHTLISPVFRGVLLQSSVRRIDIGGKHLRNYLAELVSLRHFSLVDEPWIVGQMKEDACFVSSDFGADLERTWKGADLERTWKGAATTGRAKAGEEIVVDYVLPDYDRVHRGFTRPHDPVRASRRARIAAGHARPTDADDTEGEQEEGGGVFALGNERFVVPELLFSPGDVGLQQSGIAETVMQSVESLPRALWQGLLGNLVVVGGSSLLPGFVERVERGVRQLAPAEVEVRARRPGDPIKSTWQGGARLASQAEHLKNAVITREDYLEHGERWVRDQFATKRVVQNWSGT